MTAVNDCNDVDEHRDDDDGNDNEEHRGSVEMNARESNGADENRYSPAFAVEAICQFNAKVSACHLMTGYRRWYIVGCYLAPFDNKTIWYVEAAMVDEPRWAELISEGDLNVDLERTGVQVLDEEIAVAVASVALEDISAHLLRRRRAWN